MNKVKHEKPIMLSRQTRIFLPWAKPYGDTLWVETAVALTIRPLLSKYPNLRFWFTRYLQDARGSAEDTDLRIPTGFERNGNYRSLRFRYYVEEKNSEQLETEIKQNVSQAKCWISDCRDFDDLGVMAAKRFCGGDFSDARREKRRDLIVSFLHTTALLFIHMIEGPDANGEFRLEHNTDDQNPNDSTLESVHHLFCNITEPPLEVLVASPVIGTRMYHGKIQAQPVRVRF